MLCVDTDVLIVEEKRPTRELRADCDSVEAHSADYPVGLDGGVSAPNYGKAQMAIGMLTAACSRMPEKQIVAQLRHAKSPTAQLYVAEYDRKLLKREQRRRAAENENRKVARARLRAEPRRRIEEEAKHRLRALERAIRYRHGDKFLEQLSGRAGEIIEFWKALQLATLGSGKRASDQSIADEFNKTSTEKISRHQARSRRKLIEKLECIPYAFVVRY